MGTHERLKASPDLLLVVLLHDSDKS